MKIGTYVHIITCVMITEDTENLQWLIIVLIFYTCVKYIVSLKDFFFYIGVVQLDIITWLYVFARQIQSC